MIYKREEYVEEGDQNSKFPIKQVQSLTPVGGEGKARFVGSVTLGLQTPMGVQQFPISFEIQAEGITEAFQKFESAAEPKIAEARKNLEEELRKARREASSRIVRPDEVGLGGQGQGPGGGNIVDFGDTQK